MSIDIQKFPKTRYIYFMENSPLVDYLFGLWREYDDLTGRRTTQVEFGKYLGIDRLSINHLMTGRRSGLSLESVIDIYRKTSDPVIFELAGYQEYKPAPPSWSDFVKSSTPEEIVSLADTMNLWKSLIDAKGIKAESPEALEILVELVKRSNDASMR